MLDLDASFLETLPWIDYREVFQKIEERGRNEREMELAVNAFLRSKHDAAYVVEFLVDCGISGDTIIAAREKAERAGKSGEEKQTEPVPQETEAAATTE